MVKRYGTHQRFVRVRSHVHLEEDALSQGTEQICPIGIAKCTMYCGKFCYSKFASQVLSGRTHKLISILYENECHSQYHKIIYYMLLMDTTIRLYNSKTTLVIFRQHCIEICAKMNTQGEMTMVILGV